MTSATGSRLTSSARRVLDALLACRGARSFRLNIAHLIVGDMPSPESGSRERPKSRKSPYVRVSDIER
ncbi:hypothetical protein, partial [Streptomyces sp. OspMP-M43]|uniref:hypothetical protein n=1 Tax=Streptomyces sp. OspMP-M43 TaxID=1839781 RepID=UPI00195F7986